MNAKQLNHLSVARTFLHPTEPQEYVPIHLRGKILSDDSCWDELDSEYDESIPSLVSNFLDEVE